MSRESPTNTTAMQTVTAKSTKAEILAAYQELVNRPPVLWSDVPGLIVRTAMVLRKEVPLLVKDCVAAGRWLRSQANLVIEELSQPLFKS